MLARLATGALGCQGSVECVVSVLGTLHACLQIWFIARPDDKHTAHVYVEHIRSMMVSHVISFCCCACRDMSAEAACCACSAANHHTQHLYSAFA